MKPFICINYTDAGLKNAKTRDLVASIEAYSQWWITELSTKDQRDLKRVKKEVASRTQNGEMR